MRKTTVVLASLLTVMILLASCGGDGDAVVDAGDDSGQDATVDTGDDSGDQLPLGAGPYPVGTLTISITHPDADPIDYTISCLGDTATITPPVVGLNEMTACDALNEPEVRTLLIDGPAADRICTEQYGGPDEATITGTLDDEPIDTVITRQNGCGIDDWDRVLSAILPAARGVTE